MRYEVKGILNKGFSINADSPRSEGDSSLTSMIHIWDETQRLAVCAILDQVGITNRLAGQYIVVWDTRRSELRLIHSPEPMQRSYQLLIGRLGGVFFYDNGLLIVDVAATIAIDVQETIKTLYPDAVVTSVPS